jgi:putative transposase
MLKPMRRRRINLSSPAATRSTIEQGTARSTLKSGRAKFTIESVNYRGFASKLHHEVPSWVESGSLFHIRIRIHGANPRTLLIDPTLAHRLLDSARFYESEHRWHISIFLLMPDHLHAVLSFPRDQRMSVTVADWKHFHRRTNHITWQEGFFDHRLRDDERGEQRTARIDYIRRNPVAAGLCAKAEDWPWIIDPSRA